MITEIINCPVCNKEIEVIKNAFEQDIPEFSLNKHMVEGHKPIEIIRSYTAYYLESIDYPLSPQEGTLYWGIEMAIKFSDDQILVYCGKV